MGQRIRKSREEQRREARKRLLVLDAQELAVRRRVADYCDGWSAVDSAPPSEGRIGALADWEDELDRVADWAVDSIDRIERQRDEENTRLANNVTSGREA